LEKGVSKIGGEKGCIQKWGFKLTVSGNNKVVVAFRATYIACAQGFIVFAKHALHSTGKWVIEDVKLQVTHSQCNGRGFQVHVCTKWWLNGAHLGVTTQRGSEPFAQHILLVRKVLIVSRNFFSTPLESGVIEDVKLQVTHSQCNGRGFQVHVCTKWWLNGAHLGVTTQRGSEPLAQHIMVVRNI
jgi:hypothetical protein